MNSRVLSATAIVLLLLSTVSFIIFIVFHFSFMSIFVGKEVKKNIVINPKYKRTYDLWKSNDREDSPAINRFDYYFYNLTNAFDFYNNGAVPNFVEVGPYSFKKFRKRVNDSFSDDKTLVTYNKIEYYRFDRNATPETLSLDDVIYNVNPSYIGVLSQTGGENNLKTMMTAAAIENIIELLTTTFVEKIKYEYYRPLLLVKQSIKCFAKYLDLNQFYETWSNSFTPPYEEFVGMLLSEGYHTPTNIPLNVAAELFNPVNEYSIVNFMESSSSVWEEIATKEDEESIQLIMSRFSLTREQVLRIGKWCKNFVDSYVVEQIRKEHPSIEDINDIGWMQWSSGNGSPLQRSVKEENASLIGYPEFYFFSKKVLNQEVSLDYSISKQVLNGTKALFNPENLMKFLHLYEKGEYNKIHELWNIEKKNVIDTLRAYITYIKETFVDEAYQDTILKQNIGFITRKSINEWLFNYTDPLLILFKKPELANNTTFLRNDTTSLPSITNTGYKDIELVQQKIQDNGIKEVFVWRNPLKIQGTNGEQFSPNLHVGDSVKIWQNDLKRDLKLNSIQKERFKDIEMIRFEIDNKEFEKRFNFYQSIQGFFNTSFIGFPLFISSSHFYNCDPRYIRKLSGIKGPSKKNDGTYLLVEPITGITMNAESKFQVNLYIPKDSNWFDQSKIPSDIFLPIMYFNQIGTATDSALDEFRKKINFALTVGLVVEWLSFAFFICFGLAFAIVLIMAIALSNSDKRKRYVQIRDK